MAKKKTRQTKTNMAQKKKKMKKRSTNGNKQYSNANSSNVITPSDITIRDFVLSDVVDYMVWRSDYEVTRFNDYIYFSNVKIGFMYLDKYVIPHPWHKAICLRGCPVGEIKFEQGIEEDMCRGQITYMLAKKYWGKGIGTLAVKLAVLRIFRESEEVERIEAVEHLENVRSQRVLEKVGFLRECVLRKYWYSYDKGAEDMLMYSLLRTDIKEYGDDEDDQKKCERKECHVLSDISDVFQSLQL